MPQRVATLTCSLSTGTAVFFDTLLRRSPMVSSYFTLSRHKQQSSAR
jgi:hypothetical protein